MTSSPIQRGAKFPNASSQNPIFTTFKTTPINLPTMSQNGEKEDIYNNSHRAFLQSFISHATLTFEQAKPILAAIFRARCNVPCPKQHLVLHRTDPAQMAATFKQTTSQRRT